MLSRTEPSSGIKLTEWTTCGGCAAKWGGADLAEIFAGLSGGPAGASELELELEGLLVGLSPFDDAAVYQLSADVALVSTTDFFPPLVDDPADFGAVAAANACSDIFAMGARVVLALNISAFPETLPVEAVAAIISAAAAVVQEAGGVVAGGHTIRSKEPIFGLAVQGLVNPAKVLTKSGARPGDVVLLSKPLGTGIVLAGGTPDDKALVVEGMRSLNRVPSELLVGLGEAVHALTDVTGFGLLGHAFEMSERSGASIVLGASALPLYPGALDAASDGVRTGGDERNRKYLAGNARSKASEALLALAYDPQTSGGLLCAVAPEVSDDLARAGFSPVGEVVAGPPGVLLDP